MLDRLLDAESSFIHFFLPSDMTLEDACHSEFFSEKTFKKERQKGTDSIFFFVQRGCNVNSHMSY